MALTWLWKLEDVLVRLIGPAQMGDQAEDARRDQAKADAPAVAPKVLGTGGWERRGTPGDYYIVKTESPKDPT